MNTYCYLNPPSGFYIYAYIRDNGTPYYIGKGQGNRAVNRHYFGVPKNRSQIIILEQNLTEIGAFALERRLIRWWGRKDLGTGILNNLTDGGEGSVGKKVSEETKEKLRQINLGKKVREDVKQKISASSIGKKKGPLSDATRLKMRLAKLGKPGAPRTPQWLANQRLSRQKRD